MEEWSFEVEWSQILCSLVGLTKTHTEVFLLRHITTLISIQARIIFFKDISCLLSLWPIKMSDSLYGVQENDNRYICPSGYCLSP